MEELRDIFILRLFDWLALKSRRSTTVLNSIWEGESFIIWRILLENPVMRQIRNMNVVVVSHVTPTSLMRISYERIPRGNRYPIIRAILKLLDNLSLWKITPDLFLFLLEARIFTLVVLLNFDETNLSIFFFFLYLATLQREKIEEESRRNPLFFFFSP